MSSSSTTASARLPREDDPLAHAEALIAQGHAGDAAQLLRDLVEAGRGGFLLRAGLVQALIAAGQSDAALAAAREAAALYPSVADAALLLGEALFRAGELPQAIGEFQRALRQDPALAEARRQLGLAWLEAGEAQKALEAFDEIGEGASELAPWVAEARAMLARPRSDPRYVRHLFDQFSGDYNLRMLAQLGYRAPAILRELAGLVMMGGARTILDLGCGTGLSGAAFKELAARLDGVDLSPAMIGKARARGIYNELTVADLELVLEEGGRRLRSHSRRRHARLSGRSGSRVSRRGAAPRARGPISVHGRNERRRRVRAGSQTPLAPFGILPARRSGAGGIRCCRFSRLRAAQRSGRARRGICGGAEENLTRNAQGISRLPVAAAAHPSDIGLRYQMWWIPP